MTDERIKEEIDNIVSAYMRNPCGEKIDSVLLPYIRAVERLAKIEALEKVVNNAVPGFTMAYIENQIAELKEAGE